MKRRIVGLYLVLAIIVASVVTFISYRYSSQMYIEEVENELKNEAMLVARIIGDKGIGNNGKENISDGLLKELSGIMTSVARESGTGGTEYPEGSKRITLIDRNGGVLADSYASSTKMENHSDRAEVIQALKNGNGVDIRKSETTGNDLIYVAYYSRELGWIVRISASVEHINKIRDTILFYALIAVAAALAISTIIALMLSGYALKPLTRLVKEYGGSADAHKNFTGKREDEVGQLSTALSTMTSNIESIIRELKDRNAGVNTIINSMTDGLIAVDRSMQILMVNPIAIKMFGAVEKAYPVGVPLVQVIRNRKVNDLLLKGITGNKVINDEIYLYQGGKRILSIHVSPIYPMDNKISNTGALAFINDITQVRKLEDMRSEFVSNVTHELKTPLTSIQGFVETLKAGAINDSQVSGKFLDIIEIEVDRLRTLINDILELSEIEGIKHDSDTQVFPLLPLVKEVESMLANSASEKDITLNSQIPEELALNANRHRIKQLLINLMDNAIKYNKQGGTVDVRAKLTGNLVEINVEDTGIGIPASHTDRIFERFYRVDKGRSREMGGTGLGLSIVKHIAQLYGGTVRVESEEGKGSNFIVTLPRRDDK